MSWVGSYWIEMSSLGTVETARWKCFFTVRRPGLLSHRIDSGRDKTKTLVSKVGTTKVSAGVNKRQLRLSRQREEPTFDQKSSKSTEPKLILSLSKSSYVEMQIKNFTRGLDLDLGLARANERRKQLLRTQRTGNVEAAKSDLRWPASATKTTVAKKTPAQHPHQDPLVSAAALSFFKAGFWRAPHQGEQSVTADLKPLPGARAARGRRGSSGKRMGLVKGVLIW